MRKKRGISWVPHFKNLKSLNDFQIIFIRNQLRCSCAFYLLSTHFHINVGALPKRLRLRGTRIKINKTPSLPSRTQNLLWGQAGNLWEYWHIPPPPSLGSAIPTLTPTLTAQGEPYSQWLPPTWPCLTYERTTRVPFQEFGNEWNKQTVPLLARTLCNTHGGLWRPTSYSTVCEAEKESNRRLVLQTSAKGGILWVPGSSPSQGRPFWSLPASPPLDPYGELASSSFCYLQPKSLT